MPSRAMSVTRTWSWPSSATETPIQRIDMSAMPGEEGKPVFIVYRHEDIQTMLRDNETYSSNVVIQIFGGRVWATAVMLGMDEPVHGRLRSLVTKAFTQKVLARWEDEIVAGASATNSSISSPRTARRTWSRRSRSRIRPASSPRRSASQKRTSAVPAVVDLD